MRRLQQRDHDAAVIFAPHNDRGSDDRDRLVRADADDRRSG